MLLPFGVKTYWIGILFIFFGNQIYNLSDWRSEGVRRVGFEWKFIEYLYYFIFLQVISHQFGKSGYSAARSPFLWSCWHDNQGNFWYWPSCRTRTFLYFYVLLKSVEQFKIAQYAPFALCPCDVEIWPDEVFPFGFESLCIEETAKAEIPSFLEGLDQKNRGWMVESSLAVVTDENELWVIHKLYDWITNDVDVFEEGGSLAEQDEKLMFIISLRFLNEVW